jgi:hypothetical protein
MIKKIATAVLFVMTTSITLADPIVTDSTSRSSVDSTSNSTTTIKSPPPTAVAPAITSINNDLCAVGVSGAAQTQILGIAIGSTFVDKNCERLKLSKTLFDMGMKVAAVATLCQDERVFTAMINAGTPCPIDGKIGEAAKVLWEQRETEDLGTKNKPIGHYGSKLKKVEPKVELSKPEVPAVVN